MTDTPLALDAIEARAVAVAHHRTGPGRCACGYDAYKVGGFFPDYHALLMNHLARAPRAVTPANTDDVLALVAALRKAQAEVERLRKPHRACEACGCDGCEYCQDEALIVRAEKAEAQVAAVLALCDEAAPRRMGDGYLSASVLAPEDVRAAVEGAGDVPMSPDMGHDLRERIAQRIDQAWAEANDRRPRSEYRDGYLDGLEHAEAAARSTPLTMGGAS